MSRCFSTTGHLRVVPPRKHSSTSLGLWQSYVLRSKQRPKDRVPPPVLAENMYPYVELYGCASASNYVVQAYRQDNSPPLLQRKGVSFADRSLERSAENEGLPSAALGSRYSPVVPNHVRVFLLEETAIFFAAEHHYPHLRVSSAGYGGRKEGRGSVNEYRYIHQTLHMSEHGG